MNIISLQVGKFESLSTQCASKRTLNFLLRKLAGKDNIGLRNLSLGQVVLHQPDFLSITRSTDSLILGSVNWPFSISVFTITLKLELSN